MRYVDSRYRADLAPWVANCAQMERLPANHHAIGIETDSGYGIGVVYEGWGERDVRMHVALKRGFNFGKAFLWMAFNFPFNLLGAHRVTVMVPESNEASLRFCARLGFVVEGVHREAALDGGDIISMGMLKRECRWLALEERAIREVTHHEQVKVS